MSQSEADRLVELANELSNAGRIADAEGANRAAAKAAPSWSVPWYNLGLLCKYQRRWQESFSHNQKAVELDPTDGDAWWNLGIAATAVADWTVARRAWFHCGITLPDGSGAPDGDYGPVPVRLDPDGRGEVVWATRIDPARARLENVPLPTSTFRWNDLVLHDGAVQGTRLFRGKELPVFNVLDIWQQSEYATWVVELGTSDPNVIKSLQRIADEAGAAAENWGSNTRLLCRECSLGLPHEHRDDGVSAHPHCGVAARNQAELQSILDSWLATTPGADVVRWSLGSSAA